MKEKENKVVINSVYDENVSRTHPHDSPDLFHTLQVWRKCACPTERKRRRCEKEKMQKY
jgi:hypothetical protein